MPQVIDPSHVEIVCRTLMGATDVDGGMSSEQRAVLQALVSGYWGRPDLGLDALSPADPRLAASEITDPAHRRRVGELMMLLELCRHPLSDAQVCRFDEYAEALDLSGPGLSIARDLVREGAEQAAADYQRCVDQVQGQLAEPSLREQFPASLERPDPELASRLRELHELPAGTLGYEYVEFYRRNGFTLPGDDVHMPAVFVEHDMCHVIAGYEPTGPGEIALGAMQLGVSDTDAHWVGFLGNLAVHEAQYTVSDNLVSKEATLARPGACELLAEGLSRGARCTGDFTTADHLGMADVPLNEVRERFGVPKRVGDGVTGSTTAP